MMKRNIFYPKIGQRRDFRQVLHLDGCLVATFPAFFSYFALVVFPSRESLLCKKLLEHLRQLIYSEIYSTVY